MAVVVTTKCPQIAFGFSKTCESDCESIKINFTDGLVTQFLLEPSSNVGALPCARLERCEDGADRWENGRGGAGAKELMQLEWWHAGASE